MRAARTNMTSTLATQVLGDSEPLLATKPSNGSALAQIERKGGQAAGSNLAQAGVSAGRSRAQGHMQHRRFGKRHR
jgi:hypothetical protein